MANIPQNHPKKETTMGMYGGRGVQKINNSCDPVGFWA